MDIYRLIANLYGVESLRSLFKNFYLADFFDVLIIAVLIYAALSLFKQTRSFLILVGIGIITALYVAAQLFNLYLTALVLQSFFGVFLVVLVILFQDELKRFFEFIAAVGTRQVRIGRVKGAPPTITEIIQAAADMAHNKIGALIVVPGEENIERLIEGGIIIDGVISQELILSIFDPNSPGHDGAAVIGGNRMSKFGVRLPLSKNFKEIGKKGTRHSAALGLSERSDALIIVVSEETGNISVARQGRLKTLKGAEELEQVLSRFIAEKQKQTEEKFSWRNFIRRNSFEKIFAIALASLIWFFTSFQAGTAQKEFLVPVSFRNIPAGFVIEDFKPKEIEVTLLGRGQGVFEGLDAKSLEIAIDSKEIKIGQNTVAVNESAVKKPINLSVVKIEPLTIQLTAQKFSARETAIKVKTSGVPPTNVKIASLSPSPDKINVLVAEGVNPPEFITTEPINLSEVKENAVVETMIVLPKGMRLKEDKDKKISVKIELEKK